jgi:hypothetical protein
MEIISTGEREQVSSGIQLELVTGETMSRTVWALGVHEPFCAKKPLIGSPDR